MKIATSSIFATAFAIFVPRFQKIKTEFLTLDRLGEIDPNNNGQKANKNIILGQPYQATQSTMVLPLTTIDRIH